jgi:lipopolysaccharide export system permease protein
MIKTLDRYVLREMFVPFLIGTVSVVLMFQANMLIALFKTLSLTHVPPGAIAQLLLFKTPNFLQMTLPVGVALASSLAISRLARESELTAMRAAGMSIRRVVRPVVFAGLAVAALNFFVVERVMPPSEFKARRLMNDVQMLALNPDFRSNVTINLKNYTASFGSVTRGRAPGEVVLNDVTLIERRSPKEIVLITADRGTYKEGNWTILAPYFRYLKGNDLISASTQRDLKILEPISVPDFFLSPTQEEKSMVEILAAIKQAKLLRQDTRGLETALHTRLSVPAACFVFALTGSMFAVWMSRAGPFVGVLFSLAMVLAYYNAFVISTEIFGRNGWLPPIAAAWLPNVIFFLLGLWAIRRAE